MKTPMKELIDEAIKYSRELSTKGCLPESLAVDHIIELAESMLEKEKEVMCEFAKIWEDNQWYWCTETLKFKAKRIDSVYEKHF